MAQPIRRADDDVFAGSVQVTILLRIHMMKALKTEKVLCMSVFVPMLPASKTTLL